MRNSEPEPHIDNEALEEFLNEHPELREQYEILSHISKESHRGMALIAAAELDRLLLELFKAFLRPGQGQIALLKDSNALLNTFSGKISTAHALNLISDQEFKDLNIIRRVRNDFAHVMNVSFDHQTVQSRVKELSQFRPEDGITEVFEATVIKLSLELSALIRGASPIDKGPPPPRLYNN